MKLSIFCVTKAEACAIPFLAMMRNLAEVCGAEFIIAADGRAAYRRVVENIVSDQLILVDGEFINQAIEQTMSVSRGEYTLHLEDDECSSTAMTLWLWNEEYTVASQWKFPRFNLWATEKSAIITPPLFPDYQLRLLSKSLKDDVEIAPVAIEHHKFLVKTYSERQLIATKKDYQDVIFSVPEDILKEADVVDVGDGFIPWSPKARSTRAIF
jgi:hypothetical protein